MTRPRGRRYGRGETPNPLNRVDGCRWVVPSLRYVTERDAPDYLNRGKLKIVEFIIFSCRADALFPFPFQFLFVFLRYCFDHVHTYDALNLDDIEEEKKAIGWADVSSIIKGIISKTRERIVILNNIRITISKRNLFSSSHLVRLTFYVVLAYVLETSLPLLPLVNSPVFYYRRNYRISLRGGNYDFTQIYPFSENRRLKVTIYLTKLDSTIIKKEVAVSLWFLAMTGALVFHRRFLLFHFRSASVAVTSVLWKLFRSFPNNFLLRVVSHFLVLL